MALLFMDGFDHYATADLAKKYNSAGASCVIASASGRRSGGALRHTSSTPGVTKTLPAAQSFVIGLAFNASSFAIGPAQIAGLLDAGTTQCSLMLNVDGTLSVVRGTGTAVTGGTSAYALSAGVYAYIEWKVTISDSIGASSCKVRVNGADVITVATGQDLKQTANATANQVKFGPNSSISTITHDNDDLYVCDQSGPTNNDFLGDVRIDTLYPAGAGNYTQFTPSAGANYTCVDETAPNTTDYVDGATVGDRDSYAMGNLAAIASQAVYGVQVNAAILKDDAGAKSASTFVRSVSTNGDGASAALGTSQAYVSQVFETDPNGAIAWTEASVNAMEAGVRVTA